VAVGMHSCVTFLRKDTNLATFSKSMKHVVRKEWECHFNAANKCSAVLKVQMFHALVWK